MKNNQFSIVVGEFRQIFVIDNLGVFDFGLTFHIHFRIKETPPWRVVETKCFYKIPSRIPNMCVLTYIWDGFR